MAKAGMRRPDPGNAHGTESNKKSRLPKNTVNPVPEIQGKAKHGNAKAKNLYSKNDETSFQCNKHEPT